MSALFMRAAVLYFILGICIGIYQAITRDLSQVPTHAHVGLLGWVSMVLMAVFYRLWPAAEGGLLPKVQFWLMQAGVLGITIGVGLIHGGYPEADPLAAVSSILVLLSALSFAVIVYGATAKGA